MKEKKYVTFSNNLKYYMAVNNKTRNDLCNDLKLKYTTIREWCNGTSFPRFDKIEKLASYFNINISSLIEEPHHTLLNSNIRNNMLLDDYIRDLSNSKEQEELLLNCTMLNSKYTKLLNEQAKYFLNKQEMEGE